MVSKKQEIRNHDKYERDIIDVDELEGTDVKINPDYYIHMILLKIQDACVKDDVQGGLLQYRILVEQLEVYCKSSEILDVKEYEEAIAKYKNTDEYINETKSINKMAKLATMKLGLITAKIFKSKTLVSPLNA